MKHQLNQNAAESKKSKTTKKDQPVVRTFFNIPYVKGLSKALSCVFQTLWYSDYHETPPDPEEDVGKPQEQSSHKRHGRDGVPDTVQVRFEY